MKPLHVTIDISSLQYGRGVSRYTSNLVTALAARPDVELTLFGRSLRQAGVLRSWVREFGSRVHSRILPVPPQIFDKAWLTLGVPKITWLAPKTQVYHAWEWQLAPVSSTPQVVTIHDLAHMLYPETAHPNVVAQFDRLIKTLEQQPWPIIAVSEATKKDILHLTSISPERITVVHEALPQESKVVPSAEEEVATLKKFGLKKPFILIVGTTEPRKNIPRLIEAWKPLKGEFDLVIAGAAGWDEFATVPGMHLLGYVAPAELAALYRSAHCLAYASLYEGFGLPILEAFFHGCPVVTSRVSSMPEVAGDVAILVDPYSEKDIRRAFEAVPESPKERERLKKKMTEQLAHFSWDRAAEETLKVYRKAQEQS